MEKEGEKNNKRKKIERCNGKYRKVQSRQACSLKLNIDVHVCQNLARCMTLQYCFLGHYNG
jgi:hypothetical protein